MAKPRGAGLEISDAQSGERTLLLPSGKDPVWSPDGRQIVFVREPSFNQYTAEEIWVVQADGTQERRLARGGYPKWAPDSKSVYFHDRSDNSIRTVTVGAEQSTPELFFEKALSWYPAVSPDGQAIAFATGGQLVVVERATRKTLMTWRTPGERGLLPGWSPDGRYVGFGGYDNSKLGLWCLDMRSSNAVQLAEGSFTLPAWSSDGKRLSFDYRGRVWETWVASQEWLELRMQNKVPVLQHEPTSDAYSTPDGSGITPRKPR